MLKSAVLLLALWPALALAQKRPITLETLYESPRRTAAGAGVGSPAVWAPDGKTFLLRQGRQPGGLRSGHQVHQGADSHRSHGFRRRRRSSEEGPRIGSIAARAPGGMRFSDSGKELLYPVGGDLFLIHLDTGKWDQMTETPVAEIGPHALAGRQDGGLPARLGPLRRGCGRRQGNPPDRATARKRCATARSIGSIRKSWT